MPVTFDYADESDPGPYPIPANAPIEGGPASTGDRHVLVVNKDTAASPSSTAPTPRRDGSWQAGSGAIWSTSAPTPCGRPGWTSADAAGLPILPGLVRYDEVAAGRDRPRHPHHRARSDRALRLACPPLGGLRPTRPLPPMGERLRLKASFDISAYSAAKPGHPARAQAATGRSSPTTDRPGT